MPCSTWKRIQQMIPPKQKGRNVVPQFPRHKPPALKRAPYPRTFPSLSLPLSVVLQVGENTCQAWEILIIHRLMVTTQRAICWRHSHGSHMSCLAYPGPATERSGFSFMSFLQPKQQEHEDRPPSVHYSPAVLTYPTSTPSSHKREYLLSLISLSQCLLRVARGACSREASRWLGRKR